MRVSDFVINRRGKIRWITFSPLDAFHFLLHGFIIKNHGLSPPRKGENIKKLLQRITSQRRRVISLSQRHRDECVILTPNDKLRRRYTGDALLTTRDDIFISVWVADCLPIFLVEEKSKVIGMIHAGWRGTLLSIVSRTMQMAKYHLGCRAQDFMVLFGPCIRSCCYRVSERVAVLFGEECVSRDRGRKPAVDLVSANVKQFLSCGVKESNIFVAESCTSCNAELFHSYRREKANMGRMAGFMGLK